MHKILLIFFELLTEIHVLKGFVEVKEQLLFIEVFNVNVFYRILANKVDYLQVLLGAYVYDSYQIREKPRTIIDYYLAELLQDVG